MIVGLAGFEMATPDEDSSEEDPDEAQPGADAST